MSHPQSPTEPETVDDTNSLETVDDTEPGTITVGTISTESGELEISVNDFTAVDNDPTTVTYEDDEDNTVTVTHSESEQHDRQWSYTLSLQNANGDESGRAVINHGPHMDRDIHDATDAIETQLWEWARHSISDRYPIHQEIEALGEPNPHPPGERPGTSEAWYYEFDHDTQEVDNPDSMYSSFVPHSRYTFKASNEDRQWYCGTLNASFNHDPPDSVDKKDGYVYGTYVYLSLTPLKPVDERINKHDTREINRRCLHHDNSHEQLSHEDFFSLIREGMNELRTDAEAINDPERNAIIEEAKRRLNEETGEYEKQMRMTGF